MSVFDFIASSKPLEDVHNPYIQYLSINEALENGIEIAEMILNSCKDRDKKILMHCESEEKMNYLEVKKELYYSEEVARLYTSLPYISQLWCVGGAENDRRLLAYIKEHFNTADEIELWRIWLNDRKEPGSHKREIELQDLDVACFSFYSMNFEKPICLQIRK